MEQPTIQVFVTKYAISSGIIETTVQRGSTRDDMLVTVGRYPTYYYLGKDAFEDRAEAVAAAEAMRQRKVASVRKQLAKLEKLSFALAPSPTPQG